MEQLQLTGLLCRLDAPSVVHPERIKAVTSYRDAVRSCWSLRHDKQPGAQTACARYIGAHVSHFSDYITDDEARREMPARFVQAFEAWCGNTFVSQWMAAGARLTVVEELQARAA